MVRGEHSHDQFLLDPTAHLVSWPEPAAAILPPLLAALQHYLGGEAEAEAGDEFMMYEFKVRLCARARAHDWTACPYAHPGEVARRRDPSRLAYSGEPCPDYRRCPGGACPRGPSCPFAHGTFELWLHPARYRTRPCRAGIACRRRVCFFAHAPGELRAAAKDEAAAAALSPKSTLAGLWESPPVSPVEGRRQRSTIDEADVDMEVEELMLATRELSVRKAKTSTPQMPVLPPATEEDGPDFGWVSELLM